MEAAILYTDCTVLLDLKWQSHLVWDEPRNPAAADKLKLKEKEVEGYIGYAPAPSGICDLPPKSR